MGHNSTFNPPVGSGTIYARILQLKRNQAAKVQQLLYYSSAHAREATREFDFSTTASIKKKEDLNVRAA